MSPLGLIFINNNYNAKFYKKIEFYPHLLDFKPITLKSIDIELSRNSINPMIVSRGSD